MVSVDDGSIEDEVLVHGNNANHLSYGGVSGPSLADMRTHITSLAAPQAVEPTSRLADLLLITQQLQLAVEQPVTFQPAIFWQNNEPVIWPRSVNLIQGQTGVHKSRVAELFGSTVLAAQGMLAGDSLGLEFRPPSEPYRLVYVDTERNISDQLPYAMQNLKRRAGYGLAEHPASFVYTSLVKLPRAERFAGLREFLTHQRLSFSGHIIVVLDVLSDCVADYNNVAGSLELMDLLNVTVNEQNVTFLAVIHENPGTSNAKARGHLGTEASNKASTVLQIGFVKEAGKTTSVLQLLYLKRRYGAPGLTLFATYDEASKSLIRAEYDYATTTTSRIAGAQPKVTPALLHQHLPTLLADGPINVGKLEAELARLLEVSARTIKNHLVALLQPGTNYFTSKAGQACRLEKIKAPTGLTVNYSLIPCLLDAGKGER